MDFLQELHDDLIFRYLVQPHNKLSLLSPETNQRGKAQKTQETHFGQIAELTGSCRGIAVG